MEDRQNDQNDDVFSFFSPSFSAATPSTLFNRSAYSSSSSSGDDESQPSVDDSNKRIDYMIQFLDRRLSEDGNHDGIGDGNGSDSLPEFVGKCGESGIFKVPIRSAVHPNRPPSLDVRPHPLRETQIGRFLRTMTSTERQLWTGGEDGALRDLIKVFNIDGQLENRPENSVYPDFGSEEEGKMKVTASKKEKAQSSLGFFQRSRNAIMGAADAVRRAATGVEIVVVGLQEVEMGAGVLAMSAAKETVGLEGSPLGQWWLDMIGKTLDEGSSFVRVK